MQQTYEIKSASELPEISLKIAAMIEDGARIILFQGQIGSGKTTLIKEVLAHFGVPKIKVKSPTFTLKNTYLTKKFIFHHLDIYRIDATSFHELEIVPDAKNVYLIEWGGKINEKLIKPDLCVEIEYGKKANSARIITLSSSLV